MENKKQIDYVLANHKYEIGNMISNKREEKGLTAAQLAALVDTSPQTISNIETGKNKRSINTEKLIRIAIALDLSLDELFNLDQIKRSASKTDNYYFEAIKTFVDVSNCSVIFENNTPYSDNESSSIFLDINQNKALAYYIQEYKKRKESITNIADTKMREKAKELFFTDFDNTMQSTYTFKDLFFGITITERNSEISYAIDVNNNHIELFPF